MVLRTGQATKTDEFSENLQRGGGGVCRFQSKKIILQILDLYLYRTFFGRFLKKKLQHNFLKMRGGAKAIWIFSESSSILVHFLSLIVEIDLSC